MTRLFADSGYWIAILSPRDQLHEEALRFSRQMGSVHIFTSEWVLIKVLNAFAEGPSWLRQGASELVAKLEADSNVTVVRYASNDFSDSLRLYRERPDKEWSLTDCASFLIMRRHNIDSALTPDHHYEQARFKALLR